MRTFQRSVIGILALFITGIMMSFQTINYTPMPVEKEIKAEILSVKISKINGADGQVKLVAHHPRNPNLGIYTGSHYQVDWFTGRGEPIASNTVEIPYSCGISVIVVVKKRFSVLSGGDDYQAPPCSPSGYEPDGPMHLYPNQ